MKSLRDATTGYAELACKGHNAPCLFEALCICNVYHTYNGEPYKPDPRMIYRHIVWPLGMGYWDTY